MILVDFSQIMFAQISLEFARNKTTTVQPDLLRHMILNQLRALNVRFRGKYGEMYLIYDSSSWRTRIFKDYKGLRRAEREASTIDWGMIFEVVNEIKEEIVTMLPFAVVKAKGAEADDIIGYICSTMHETGPILVVSTDKDFKQLQHFKGVDQYSPTMDKMLKEANPLDFLKTMLLTGDKGDGIPNALSDLDSLMFGKKMTVLSKKRVETHKSYYDVVEEPFAMYPQLTTTLDCPEDFKKRIELHWNLISLVDPNNIPEDVVSAIKESLVDQEQRNKKPNVFFYLSSKGCNQLAGKAEDFFPRKIK